MSRSRISRWWLRVFRTRSETCISGSANGEAERLITASLEINRDLLGKGDPESIEVLADYAPVLTEQARF